MKCATCNQETTILFKGKCANCGKGADCHFCGRACESKYARKGHERACRSNPANMIAQYQRDFPHMAEHWRQTPVTRHFAETYFAFNARFGRGDHPKAIERAAHRFVEPYEKVSRARFADDAL